MTPEQQELCARIAAAAAHESVPVEMNAIIDVTVTEDCGTLIDSTSFQAQIMPHYYTGKAALSVRTSPHAMQIDRVDELIALLIRAKQIMQGGV